MSHATATAPHFPARVGIGPISQNTIDAGLAVAYEKHQPLMLIPSRRQIESAELGAGYVESWSTEEFARYVRERDPDGLLYLCRDHGGPYQLADERQQRMTPGQAMDSALASFREDIRCGFDLIHIDTCLDLNGTARFSDALDRLVMLYRECHEFARATGDRDLMFEIGIENQSPDTNDPAEFRPELDEMLFRLAAEGLPAPTFVVAQTGTKVMETDNVGALTVAPSAVRYAVRALTDMAEQHGVALKAHNADYLPADAVHDLADSGVHAMNIAPEFGVVETRSFLALLDELGLSGPREDFLALAYESNAWRKWMAPDTTATDFQRAVIAGHYVFSTDRFREIKQIAADTARRRGIDIDAYLRRPIQQAIERYTAALPTTAAA